MTTATNAGSSTPMKSTDDPDFSAFRFLIVDDEPFMLDLVEGVLRRCRAKEVKRYSNGQDALLALQGTPDHFDIVISDCNMKPVNGLQLLRDIRQGTGAEDLKTMPVVFLTGHKDAPVVEAAIKLGVNGFLAKPVSFEKLTGTIAKALKAAGKL